MSAEHHPCCSAWPSASSSVRLKAGPSFVHRFARPGQPVVRTACRGPWSRDATKDHSGQGERDLQWADPPTLDLLQYEHAPTVDKDLGRGPRLLAAPPIGEPSAEPPVAVAVPRGQSTIVRGSGRGGPFDQAHVREYGEGRQTFNARRDTSRVTVFRWDTTPTPAAPSERRVWSVDPHRSTSRPTPASASR